MAKLALSIAIGDYDRMRPLVSGEVQIDGADPVFMLLEPEEMFFRGFRQEAFDVCELSLSSFTVKTAARDCPYVGIPVFPSRAFRHTSIYRRTDRGIDTPADLKGRRIGTPEYQLTANVWARAILAEEYGVKPSDITWVRGGMDTPGRIEKISLDLGPDVRLENAPAHRTLNQMLEAGEIDGLIGPRAPAAFEAGDPTVDWLFDDPTAVAADWFRRTGLFPIMHMLGVRRTLVEQHAWLPAALLKAFEKSKQIALTRLADTSATKVTMPFVEDNLRRTRQLMGRDFWPYGYAANKATLEAFLRFHHDQGLSQRLVGVEELFHSSTLESFKL
jgi:4,5-dihydroxyphthalate decarboxylase